MLTFSVHLEASNSLFGTPNHGVPVASICVERIETVITLQSVVTSPVGRGDALVAADPTPVGRDGAEEHQGNHQTSQSQNHKVWRLYHCSQLLST